MPRFCLMLVSLLVLLTTASGLAQTAEEYGVQRLPLIDQTFQVQPFQGHGAVAGEMPVDQPLQATPFQNPNLQPAIRRSLTSRSASTDRWRKPRLLRSTTSWDTATGPVRSIGSPAGPSSSASFRSLGITTSKSGITDGIGDVNVGMDFNFLCGPVETDLPPRVYDFSICLPDSQQLGPLKFDLATSVLAATDFVGNARKGILFPQPRRGLSQHRADGRLGLRRRLRRPRRRQAASGGRVDLDTKQQHAL